MENSKSATPGKGLIKVTGILLIIFGAIALIFGIIAIAAVAYVGGLFDEDVSALYSLSVIYAFIPTILSFIAGIVGVKNCGNPTKAGTCFAWGIVLIILFVISTILDIVNSAFSVISIIGVVLPILFLIGAIQNRNAAQVSSQYPQ